MPKRTTKKTDKPVTTAQKLGSVIKSARDIMRTDKGLNGELDRLPQLTWIMFLKLLDDSEKLHEADTKAAGMDYKPTIKPPYRWRDWAANENFTGDKLKNFTKIGETIFDPACGTGGFLVEVYEYLKQQCTAQDWQILQKSVISAEAKSLPLMLAHMSLNIPILMIKIVCGLPCQKWVKKTG